jgi:hypothetical protein
MAETLLAVLLVTSSAKGSNVVFRWPEFPAPSPRLARPKPDPSLSLSALDNPWRASHSAEEVERADIFPSRDCATDPDYAWPRPNALRDRSLSLNHTRMDSHRSYSYSGEQDMLSSAYDQVLGFKAEFLAKILCPRKAMCHSRFELIVDDLAFVGHPVCAEGEQGGGLSWKFKPEKIQIGARGRDESEMGISVSPRQYDTPSPSVAPLQPISSRSGWLQTFHLALVLDLPDPSSSASGNLSKYFNIIYEQIAFTLTAVLYQEQVLSNFVENECDTLLALKERCISNGAVVYFKNKTLS